MKQKNPNKRVELIAHGDGGYNPKYGFVFSDDIKAWQGGSQKGEKEAWERKRGAKAKARAL